jgi:hypothetical protein
LSPDARSDAEGLHAIGGDQVDTAGVVVDEDTQFPPQGVHDAAPVLIGLHLQDFGAYLAQGETDACVLFAAPGLAVEPRVFDGDGRLVEQWAHRLDALHDGVALLWGTAGGDHRQYSVSLLDGDEVADPAPRHPDLDALVKARVVTVGDDEFAGSCHFSHDVVVVEVVTQADDVARGTHGRARDHGAIGIDGMQVGLDHLDGVGSLVDEGQGQVAEDPCFDDLASDRLEDHLHVEGGEHELSHGAKGGQQLQRFVEFAGLLDGVGHLLAGDEGAADGTSGVSQGKQLHVVLADAAGSVLFDPTTLGATAG